MPRPLSQILAEPKDEEARALVELAQCCCRIEYGGHREVRHYIDDDMGFCVSWVEAGVRQYEYYDELMDALAHAERLAAEGE